MEISPIFPMQPIPLKPPFYFLEYRPLGDLEIALKEALKMGFEGIVIKNLDSPYLISKSASISNSSLEKNKGVKR